LLRHPHEKLVVPFEERSAKERVHHEREGQQVKGKIKKGWCLGWWAL